LEGELQREADASRAKPSVTYLIGGDRAGLARAEGSDREACITSQGVPGAARAAAIAEWGKSGNSSIFAQKRNCISLVRTAGSGRVRPRRKEWEPGRPRYGGRRLAPKPAPPQPHRSAGSPDLCLTYLAKNCGLAWVFADNCGRLGAS
jgi:hypothetical protein